MFAEKPHSKLCHGISSACRALYSSHDKRHSRIALVLVWASTSTAKLLCITTNTIAVTVLFELYKTNLTPDVLNLSEVKSELDRCTFEQEFLTGNQQAHSLSLDYDEGI